MEPGTIFLGLALLLGVAFVIAQPLLERKSAPAEPVAEAEALLAERENILSALRDLDFDHATGKITTEDYTPQRAKLVAEGAAVLRQLDRLSAGSPAPEPAEDEIERAIAARRKVAAPRMSAAPSPTNGARPTAIDLDAQIEIAVAARRQASAEQPAPASAAPANRFCPQCGSPVQPDDRFCAGCGAKLVVA